MNSATIGLPENSWASAGAEAQYRRRQEIYRLMPCIWRMVPLEIPLLAGTTTGVGALAALPVFRFPRRVHVTGILLLSSLATAVAQGSLEFGVLDLGESGEGQMVSDGRFPSTSPALAMHGKQFGWFLLDRPQEHNSRWSFQIANTGAVTLTPLVFLKVETLEEDEAA